MVILAASLLSQGQTIYLPLIFKNAPPPLYSTSYYIQYADPARLYDMGCAFGARDASMPGEQDSLVILDFAQMWIENGVYGALGFEDPYASDIWHFSSFSELKDNAKAFATGYWVCSGNDNMSQLTLGIGTNNFGFFGQTNRTQENLRGIAADFGRNWAYMINDLNNWGLQNGYSSQIVFTGAMDIEWDSSTNPEGYRYWQSAYIVKGWISEFDKYDNGTSIYFNFGACVGCYDYVDPNWKFISTNYWTIFDVWYVSWGAQPAFAVPEIYRNDGFLARQWAAVSKYGSLYQGSRIVFSGVMTQMQACQQRSGTDPSCASLDNTPAEGWAQLVDAISSDAFTQTNLPRWSTDIRWQIK